MEHLDGPIVSVGVSRESARMTRFRCLRRVKVTPDVVRNFYILLIAREVTSRVPGNLNIHGGASSTSAIIETAKIATCSVCSCFTCIPAILQILRRMSRI